MNKRRWLTVRRSVLLIIALLFPVTGLAGLQWETREVRLAAPLGTREAIAWFPFKNTGTTAITVLDVLPTCDCTAAELATRNYGPGESGTVKAVFAFGDRVGPQQTVVEVITNDPAVPRTYLTLWVAIPEVMACRPTLLLWTRGEEVTEQSALVTSLEPHRIAALTLEPSDSRDFVARIEPVEAGKQYRIVVRPLATATTARIRLRCIARLDGGTEHPLAIQAMVQ